MNKHNPRYDVYMYQKKAKCKKFVVVTIIFGGRSLFSPFNAFEFVTYDFQDILSIVSIVLFQ
jgi:hypothetical protein